MIKQHIGGQDCDVCCSCYFFFGSCHLKSVSLNNKPPVCMQVVVLQQIPSTYIEMKSSLLQYNRLEMFFFCEILFIIDHVKFGSIWLSFGNFQTGPWCVLCQCRCTYVSQCRSTQITTGP